MPPRKKQTIAGSSTQAREPVSTSRNDPIDEFHPEFHHIHMPSPSARKKWDRLVRLPHRQCRFLCEETCQAMGIANDVMHLAERAGLYGVVTANLLAYRLLTLEFLSTVAYHKSFVTSDYLTFQLKNVRRELSIEKLTELIGGDTKGKVVASSEYNLEEFWDEITDSSVESKPGYNPTNSKASSIRNPAIRYFHRLLTFTILARVDAGKCLAHDAQILSAGASGWKLSAGHILAHHFLAQSEVSGKGKVRICIGAFVTPIADYFKVQITEDPVSYEIYLDKSWLYVQTFLKRDARRFLWILHQKDGECFFPLPNIELTNLTTAATQRVNWNMSSPAHKALCSRNRIADTQGGDEEDDEEETYEAGGEIPVPPSSGGFDRFDERLSGIETRLDGIDATQTQILNNQNTMMQMMQQWQQWHGFYPPPGPSQ